MRRRSPGARHCRFSCSRRPASAIVRRGSLRVLLADDHPIFRQGLMDLFDKETAIELVGEAGDGEEAIEMARQLRPEVILMDVTMPRLNGIEATRRIKEEMPDVCVIGLSMHEGEDLARAMRNSGVDAYVSKSEAADTLVATILATNAHRMAL